MKKILILILITLTTLFSCNTQEYEYKIIYYKSNRDFWNNEIKSGTCRFAYRLNSNTTIEFYEDCNKYNIGDTIMVGFINTSLKKN